MNLEEILDNYYARARKVWALTPSTQPAWERTYRELRTLVVDGRLRDGQQAYALWSKPRRQFLFGGAIPSFITLHSKDHAELCVRRAEEAKEDPTLRVQLPIVVVPWDDQARRIWSEGS